MNKLIDLKQRDGRRDAYRRQRMDTQDGDKGPQRRPNAFLDMSDVEE